MAPVPATITVNFTSNYPGAHRVCWRINGSGPYDCTTIVVCTGGGNPCSTTIPVLVDNSTCVVESFDGYVQAACEVEGSLSGRVPFVVVFTPTPPCQEWNVTCNAVGLASFNVVSPGSGYVVGSDPAAVIIGGGGTGAAAHAEIGDGGIKTWTITNGGTGYNGGGSATFLNIAAVNISGTGTGALFDVTVTAGVITTIALSAAPTSPGTGYAISDTFNFNNAGLGGTGSGVIVTVDSVNTGEVQYMVLDAAGSGYSSTPVISVPGALGILATVTAVLGQCPAFDFLLDCDSNAIGLVDPQDLGFVYIKCSAIAPTAPAEWLVSENGCCYDCVTLQVTNDDVGAHDVFYTDCTTGALITLNVAGGDTEEVCAVNNSWYWDPSFNISVATSPGC